MTAYATPAQLEAYASARGVITSGVNLLVEIQKAQDIIDNGFIFRGTPVDSASEWPRIVCPATDSPLGILPYPITHATLQVALESIQGLPVGEAVIETFAVKREKISVQGIETEYAVSDAAGTLKGYSISDAVTSILTRSGLLSGYYGQLRVDRG